MNRRSFVQRGLAASVAGLLLGESAGAQVARRRVRPSDPDWPAKAVWEQLRQSVHGRFAPIQSPFQACLASPGSAACKDLFRNIKNPYYIQDDPALTQTLGWIDAWSSQPSAYVVAPENAADIAAAVNFARKNNLRLVVKGGGHSYVGNSNAPDSLLIWTRRMQGVTMHDHFVPHGADTSHPPQRAVTVGAGAIWEQAYDAVTTKAGAYVQGGGCTTVGVAGLIQGGGFGSYSKYFGLAASGLLEAEVVTADGQIRVVNAYKHPDLLWALKGGGGGTFAVISKVTLRVHDLPEYCGRANLTVKAHSDKSFAFLIRQFIEFYQRALFNPHWGETVNFAPDNTLHVTLMHIGLSDAEAKNTWRPFLDWLERDTGAFTIQSGPTIESGLMRHHWDPVWDREYHQSTFATDPRPGQSQNHIWYTADTNQVGFFLFGYDSVWLPSSLLGQGLKPKLVEALFAASRQSTVSLHFNKGLAGAPAGVLEEARNTAMNPAVCDAFALAIVAEAEGPAYPNIRGHEPDLAGGRKAATTVQRAIDTLRSVAPDGGAYMSEASFFGSNYQAAYWGKNYDRLARIKRTYDPDCLFFVHHGVGSEQWSPDGFTRRT